MIHYIHSSVHLSICAFIHPSICYSKVHIKIAFLERRRTIPVAMRSYYIALVFNDSRPSGISSATSTTAITAVSRCTCLQILYRPVRHVSSYRRRLDRLHYMCFGCVSKYNTRCCTEVMGSILCLKCKRDHIPFLLLFSRLLWRQSHKSQSVSKAQSIYLKWSAAAWHKQVKSLPSASLKESV